MNKGSTVAHPDTQNSRCEIEKLRDPVCCDGDVGVTRVKRGGNSGDWDACRFLKTCRELCTIGKDSTEIEDSRNIFVISNQDLSTEQGYR